jgi:hypothetical protein
VLSTTWHSRFTFGIIQLLELGQHKWLGFLGVAVQVVVARIASLPHPPTHTSTRWARKIGWHCPLCLDNGIVFLHDLTLRPCIDMRVAGHVVVIAIVGSASQVCPFIVFVRGVCTGEHNPRLATMVSGDLDLCLDVCARCPGWDVETCHGIEAQPLLFGFHEI